MVATQALVQFRVDKTLRDMVNDILEAIGLDIPTAMRMFYNRIVLERGLPFAPTLPKDAAIRLQARRAFEGLRQEASQLPEMTEAEIEAEIADARLGRN